MAYCEGLTLWWSDFSKLEFYVFCFYFGVLSNLMFHMSVSGIIVRVGSALWLCSTIGVSGMVSKMI